MFAISKISNQTNKHYTVLYSAYLRRYNMKFKLIVASVALVGLTVSGFNFAEARNNGQQRQNPISSLTEEQQTKFQQMKDAQFDAIRPIRSELFAKRMELEAFSTNPNVQPETITKLTKEIVALQNQIQDKQIAFKDNVEKEFGIEFDQHGRGHKGQRHSRHNDDCNSSDKKSHRAQNKNNN